MSVELGRDTVKILFLSGGRCLYHSVYSLSPIVDTLRSSCQETQLGCPADRWAVWFYLKGARVSSVAHSFPWCKVELLCQTQTSLKVRYEQPAGSLVQDEALRLESCLCRWSYGFLFKNPLQTPSENYLCYTQIPILILRINGFLVHILSFSMWNKIFFLISNILDQEQ